jgi:ubiquinone/menaquinone biosynthesis C-methylase UbiE
LFVAGTFTQLCLADASVDAVVSLDAVTFEPDKPAAFQEVRRVLRPGGRYAFTLLEALPPEQESGPAYETTARSPKRLVCRSTST